MKVSTELILHLKGIKSYERAIPTSSVPNGKIDAFLQHDVQLVHPGADEGRRICITRHYGVDALWVEGGVKSMSMTRKLKL